MMPMRMLLVGLVLVKSASGQGKNPCHGNNIKSSPSPLCTVVSLPAGFCSACQFGAINSGGNYVNCRRTMDITFLDNTCMDALQDYVDLNSCDVRRADALADFMSSMGTDDNARQLLDFFYYAMCEEGCDCIPQEHSDRNNPVIDIHRGNCQAHAHFDIMRILPEIELIKLEGTPTPTTSLPKVKPLLQSWISSDAGNNWGNKPYTSVHPDVEFFLERLVEAEQLGTNLPFFQRCVDLETAQNRVDELGPDDFYMENQGASTSQFSLVIPPANVLQPSLFNYSVIDFDDFGNAYNIKFDPSVAGVVRVNFFIDELMVRSEGIAPYAIAGDSPPGNYFNWNPEVDVPYRIDIEGLDSTNAVVEQKSIQITFCQGCRTTCSGCDPPTPLTPSPSIKASSTPSASSESPSEASFAPSESSDSPSIKVTSSPSVSPIIASTDSPTVKASSSPSASPTDSTTSAVCSGVCENRFDSIAPPGTTSQFELVDASTNTIFTSHLFDNVVVDKAVVGTSLNIKFTPSVGTNEESVKFFATSTMSGIFPRTENVAPYALRGDSSGNYFAWDPPVDDFVILAEAFQNNGGTGALLESKQINLVVCDGCYAACCD